MTVPTTPKGYHAVTPYLIVNDGRAAIDFYRRAFGAQELMRLDGPDGAIMHAEVMIGDSPVMLADANPAWGTQGPDALDATPMSLMLYVDDVDTVFRQALDAGASLLREVSDQFYGDRTGQLRDPFGHLWTVATHIEELSQEEVQRRLNGMMAAPE